MTELADTLARDHGLPFRAGHAIAARLIAAARAQPGEPLAQVAANRVEGSRRARDRLRRERAGHDPEPASTSSRSARRMAVRRRQRRNARSTVAKETLAADEEWLRTTRARLADSARQLKAAAGAL